MAFLFLLGRCALALLVLGPFQVLAVFLRAFSIGRAGLAQGNGDSLTSALYRLSGPCLQFAMLVFTRPTVFFCFSFSLGMSYPWKRATSQFSGASHIRRSFADHRALPSPFLFARPC